MWPYSWTHVGTPSHLGHMDQVAATMPSQAHAGAADTYMLQPLITSHALKTGHALTELLN